MPWLVAERAIRIGTALPDAPFALIEKQRGAMRIVALSQRAAKLGLEAGLPLADARGRVPDLAAVPYDPQGDAALLERLAHACLRYTPSVAPDPPQGLILDITGCAHLHGGEVPMRHAIIVQMKQHGLTAHAAIAGTPDAARALARFAINSSCDYVRALPVAALETEKETREALRRAGFRTIGDLADLPRGPLATRFGKMLVDLFDRLLERQDPHIVPHRPVERIMVERRFAEPIGRTDDVLDVIEALVEQAATKLAERGTGGRAFAVRLHRSDGHIARLTVETGAPTRDPALVIRLLRERIDSLADPLDPGFGYDSIDLAVPRTEEMTERQEALEPTRHPRADIGPLLDRLAVRYGPEHVMRFRSGDSHIPERAGLLQSMASPFADAAWLHPEPGEPPLRPLALFDPPQRIEVLAAVPDGPPRRFRWRGKDYLLARQEGPERIAPEWWRRHGGHEGNPGLSRDYYRVEEAGGQRFWLFRYGLYGREAVSPDWYIHGLFA